MKIILEYGPGEEWEAEMAYKGKDFAAASECMRNYFRNRRKHADLSGEALEALEHAETAFFDYFEGLLKD